MHRITSKCVITPEHTLIAAALWLLLPAIGIVCLLGIVGPHPYLLYLAGVTLVPASMTLLAPWLRAWLEVREGLLELEEVRSEAQPVPQFQSDLVS